MEYRLFGNSGLKVSALSLGTGTFGGAGDFFKKWGSTDVAEAKRMIDISVEAGINFFDTANMYSAGMSEEILGHAIKGRRDKLIISTKSAFSMGSGPNDKGSSRTHIIEACEASLKRLGTDYIDTYFMHGFDALTPMDETLRALDNLIESGKIRYIGCSNFSGWHLMKALATSEKLGLNRYVVYQGYYSLLNREYEWELMPLGVDQNIGLMVWSPLGWGRLTGKIRRGEPLPPGRLKSGGDAGGPHVEMDHLYNVVDVLEEISKENGKTVSQIAMNWLLQRPTVCNIVVGARNEEQLMQNLGAVDWKLTTDQVNRLDQVSRKTPIYPYWHQINYDRNPKPTEW